MSASTVSVSFRIDARATCRDCGAPIEEWDEVRGTPCDVPADVPNDVAMHVDAPGACEVCGGGRVAVGLAVRAGEGERS